MISCLKASLVTIRSIRTWHARRWHANRFYVGMHQITTIEWARLWYLEPENKGRFGHASLSSASRSAGQTLSVPIAVTPQARIGPHFLHSPQAGIAHSPDRLYIRITRFCHNIRYKPCNVGPRMV